MIICVFCEYQYCIGHFLSITGNMSQPMNSKAANDLIGLTPSLHAQLTQPQMVNQAQWGASNGERLNSSGMTNPSSPPLVNKDKFTEVGLGPLTSGLPYQCCTNSKVIVGSKFEPIFSNFFFVHSLICNVSCEVSFGPPDDFR